jgi:hypothetical protein
MTSLLLLLNTLHSGQWDHRQNVQKNNIFFLLFRRFWVDCFGFFFNLDFYTLELFKKFGDYFGLFAFNLTHWPLCNPVALTTTVSLICAPDALFFQEIF